MMDSDPEITAEDLARINRELLERTQECNDLQSALEQANEEVEEYQAAFVDLKRLFKRQIRHLTEAWNVLQEVEMMLVFRDKHNAVIHRQPVVQSPLTRAVVEVVMELGNDYADRTMAEYDAMEAVDIRLRRRKHSEEQQESEETQ